MSFSTFELPIRKLIKLVFIIGGAGMVSGTIIFIVIASQAGMFRPDAAAILGNATLMFHMQYPALFIIYAFFILGIMLIVWLDRKHQRTERQKRWLRLQDKTLAGEVN